MGLTPLVFGLETRFLDGQWMLLPPQGSKNMQ